MAALLKQALRSLMAEHGLGERYACRLLEVNRSTYRYEPRPDRNAKLRVALSVVARQVPSLRLPPSLGALAGAADA